MCSLWKAYSRRRQPSSHPGSSGRPVLPRWIPMKGSSGSSRRKGSRPKSAGISVLFGTFLILLIFCNGGFPAAICRHMQPDMQSTPASGSPVWLFDRWHNSTPLSLSYSRSFSFSMSHFEIFSGASKKEHSRISGNALPCFFLFFVFLMITTILTASFPPNAPTVRTRT